MALFSTVKILQAHEYTVSILIAGFICVPAVLGPSGNLYAMGTLGAYMLIYTYCHDSDEHSKKLLRQESYREVFDHPIFKERLSKMTITPWADENQKPEAIANYFFHAHDKDGDNSLGSEEVRQLLTVIHKQSPSPGLELALSDLQQRGEPIKKATLVRLLRSSKLGEIMTGWSLTDDGNPDRVLNAKSGAQRAGLVFEVLDVDRSGCLDQYELGMLLSSWGMPEDEAIVTIREVVRPCLPRAAVRACITLCCHTHVIGMLFSVIESSVLLFWTG